MFEIRIGGRKSSSSVDAMRMANMMMAAGRSHRLEKRDTIADFWSRRLHDMQLRDDPVESSYGGGGSKSDSYGSASTKSQPESYGGGGATTSRQDYATPSPGYG